MPGFKAAKARRLEPGRAFDPPSEIDRRFTRDFEELLLRFKRAGLQIIPSLVDFTLGSTLNSQSTSFVGSALAAKPMS